MAENSHLNYMNLSRLYRENPYHKRANTILAMTPHAGFAGPGLALVAGRQMAQGDQWEQQRQDRLDAALEQKGGKADVDAQSKIIAMAVNAAKQGYNGLAVEILNKNKDLIGLDPEKYINAFNVDQKGFTHFGVADTKTGGKLMYGIGTDGKMYKYGAGGEASAVTQEDLDSLGKSPKDEKDDRTTTAKDFDRAQSDPKYMKFLVDSGKVIDPNPTPGKGKAFMIGADGVAKPVKDDQGNDLLTGTDKNVFHFPAAGKAVNPAQQAILDRLGKMAPGGGAGAPATADPAAQQKALEELQKRGKIGDQSSLSLPPEEEDQIA